MIHLDLFSGIAGFALAVDEVWPGVEHTFCEIDPYCRALLKLRYPKARIYGDIRQLTTDTYYGRQAEQELKTAGDKQCDRGIDILTGGFPCQPCSQAGKRKGTADTRWLWPEMLRVIKDFKPRWVIAENVRGLINISDGVVFEQVCLDLEAQGYEVQPFIIPACAVNAPHRRDRVWITAYDTTSNRRNSGQHNREKRQIQEDINGKVKENKQERDRRFNRAREADYNAPNPISKRSRGRVESNGQILESESPEVKDKRPSWEKNWLEVATRLCSMDDGLPAELDGLKLSKARHRVERLKALGNSIVVPLAVEIMRAIKYSIDNS